MIGKVSLQDIKYLAKAGALNTVSVEFKDNAIKIYGVMKKGKVNISIGKSIDCKESEEISEDGKIIIDKDMIKLLSGNTLDIKGKTITSNGRVINIREELNEELIEQEEIEQIKQVISMEFKSFKKEIEIIYATANEDVRPVLRCIYLDKNKLVALDGYRMEIRELNCTYTTEEGFLIPKEVVQAMRKLPTLKGEIKVEVYETYIKFNIDGYWIKCNRLDGKFVDYMKLLPQDKKTSISIEASEIYKIFKELNKVRFSHIVMDIKNNRIGIKATMFGFDVEESIGAQVEGEDLLISFRTNYLVDALKVHSGIVKFEFSNNVSPVIISGGNIIDVVLPIRTN